MQDSRTQQRARQNSGQRGLCSEGPSCEVILVGRLVQEAAAIFFFFFFFSFLILGTQAAKQLGIWFDWAFLWDFKGSKPLQYSGSREKEMHSSDVLQLIQPRNSVAAGHQERPQPGARSRILAGHRNKSLAFTYLPLRAACLQAFMFLLGTRSVPVGFAAPLKTPSQAQHLASIVDFLEAPCLCLSTSYSRWTLGQGLLLQLLLLRSCDCSFTPGGAHLFPREATCALLFSASVCPSVSLGVIFLGHRKPVGLQGS